jgi:hypothetical protein
VNVPEQWLVLVTQTLLDTGVDPRFLDLYG